MPLAPRRYDLLESHFVYRTDLFRRPLNTVLVTDFFGSVSLVKQAQGAYPIAGAAPASAPTPGSSAHTDPERRRGQCAAPGWDGAGGDAACPIPEQPHGLLAGMVADAGPDMHIDWVTWSGMAALLAAVAAASILRKPAAGEGQ